MNRVAERTALAQDQLEARFPRSFPVASMHRVAEVFILAVADYQRLQM